MTSPLLSDDVTAFLITVGETTTTAARAALGAQTMPVRVDVIDHVAPMDRAFQEMLTRVATPVFVQVDADMILAPTAVERLVTTLSRAAADVAFVCGPLWDEFERRPLYGVKAYRSEILRRYPYRGAYSCETDQMARLRADGYRVELLPLGPRERCLGLHGTAYTPEAAFRRWKRLVIKQRRSVAEKPPWGALGWTEAYYARHLAWYAEDRDPARLAALFGMVAGLAAEPTPEGGEDDFRARDPGWERIAERWFSGERRLPAWVTEW